RVLRCGPGTWRGSGGIVGQGAECGTVDDGAAARRAVSTSFLKIAYDRVVVWTSRGSAGSMMKRTGMSGAAPACRGCAAEAARWQVGRLDRLQGLRAAAEALGPLEGGRVPRPSHRGCGAADHGAVAAGARGQRGLVLLVPEPAHAGVVRLVPLRQLRVHGA